MPYRACLISKALCGMWNAKCIVKPEDEEEELTLLLPRRD